MTVAVSSPTGTNHGRIHNAGNSLPLPHAEIAAMLPEDSTWRVLESGGNVVVVSLSKCDPDWCKRKLESDNDVNYRSESKDTAEKFAAAIASGNWDFNGATIVMDWDGKLRDGQTRLLAGKLSGLSFVSLIVIGIDSDLNMDRGRKRRFADVLRKRGESNVNVLTAAITLVAKHERGQMHWNGGLTEGSTQKLLDVLERNPRIRSSVAFSAHRASGLVAASILSGLHYLFGKQDGRDVAMADKFVEKFSTGLNLTQDDPIWRLRQKLSPVGSETGKRRKKMEIKRSVLLADFIIAWNFWKAGKPCKSLRWIEIGPSAQPFPEIQ